MEICRNDAWGTVCDDAWTDVDASVACRQLGYSRFSGWPPLIVCTGSNLVFMQNTSRVW